MLNYINNGEIFMDNRVLFNIGYGLYVLTAQEGNQDNGCIINTVMQVTSDPCQIAIAVNKRNYTNQMIQHTKKFNISVLSENAKFDTFKHFGFQSGRDVDKFATFNDIKRSPNGLLYITKDTNSYMSAFVKQEIDLGTHTLFIAQLVAAETLSDIPTATYTYYQQNIKPKPEKTEKRGWRCKICGFIYEGDDLPADYICPVCKHGACFFMKAKKLDELKNKCLKCKKCELGETRNNIVFSDGNPKTARAILIGEAPGENEDKTGTPFVGRAGKLLNEFLEKAEISREKDLYIINTVKCRPPKNRVPTDSEKAACEEYLLKQIETIDPKIMIFCGATALKSFYPQKTAISKIRGEVLELEIGGKKRKCIPIFHPSYLLRYHSLEEGSPRDLMLKDLKKIQDLIKV